MAVPFTQYLLPNGRQVPVSVERPADVEEMAQRFIEAGGRYECEVLTTGQISLTAVLDVDDEPQDVEIVICRNGPDVLAATDRLVAASIRHIAPPGVTE
jgi:hypothetical protein